MKKLLLNFVTILLATTLYSQTAVQPLGSGTESEPYLIETLDNLYWIQVDVERLDKHYVQTADIDASATSTGEGWNSIGEPHQTWSTTYSFTGTYDGGGYTISNLHINRPESSGQGLFGGLYEATVRNVHLVGIHMVTAGSSGGLAGTAYWSDIENCTVTGTLTANLSETEVGNNVGGLVGNFSRASMHNCWADVTVTGDDNVGGLLGRLAGFASASDYWTYIQRCYATGNVEGENNVGGLVGHVGIGHPAGSSYGDGHGIITDCYSTANVLSLIDEPENIGGFVGLTSVGSIHRSFSTGLVDAEGETVGGFAGSSGGIHYSYWNSETSQQIQTAGNAIALTTLEMQDMASFPAFNFQTIWQMGTSHPEFRDMSTFDFSLLPDIQLTDLAGSGIESNPYLISNAAELNAVRLDVTAHYKQTQNIDLSNSQVWNTGRGWLGIPDFAGTYDGDGHSISGLHINRPSINDIGLFRSTQENAVIKNVILENVCIHGRINIGSLAGEMTSTNIENITADGHIVSSHGTVGGIVGLGSSGSLLQKLNYSGKVYSTGGNAGGITGSLMHTGTLLLNATADVTVEGTTNVGGIVGFITSRASLRISNAKGTIKGEERVGGVAGRVGNFVSMISYPGYIYDSYSMAGVTGTNDVGGFTGILTSGNIYRTYSIGAVSGEGESVGGFSGSGGSNVSFSYWNTETSLQTESAAGEGRTTAEMTFPHDVNTYEEWNFVQIWKADTDGNLNDGYPYFDESYFLLDYTTDGNGTIEGETIQIVWEAGDGSPVEAIPDAGFLFDQWSDGSTQNPRTDLNITENIMVTAEFYRYSASLTYHASLEGSISGDTEQTVLYGEDGTEVEAIPNSGYDFVAWCDGRTDNPRTDVNVTDDIAVTAIFSTEILGDGSEQNPYQISSSGHLYWLATNDVHWDKHFVQTGDIDFEHITCSGVDVWTPIGNNTTKFTGTYIGNGYKISNMTIYNPDTDYIGLFGYTENASISNLIIDNILVEGKRYTGALVGRANNSFIDNVSVTGNIVGNEDYTGGLVGLISAGQYIKLVADVSVIGAGYTGGLIGDIAYNSSSEVVYSFSKGTVEGTFNTGGFVGRTYGGIITDCYSMAEVTGTNYVGGFVGRRYGGSIHRAYSTGFVTGDSDVGGFSGSGSNFTHSYWDTETSGQETSAGGIGKTTIEMQQKATFAPFNFYSAWQIVEGNGYPEFQDFSMHVLPEDVVVTTLAGSGTVEDPYIITNINELNAMSQDLTAHYKLNVDIDLTASLIWNYGSGWEAIGDNTTKFTGSFDGNGKLITGLTINKPKTDYQGLFGYTDIAQIKDIHLLEAQIFGDSYTGAVAGRTDNSNIDNVSVTGNIVGNDNYTGGLVGLISDGQYIKLVADVSVIGTSYTGGLLGRISAGEVRYSYSKGTVNGTSNTGGFVGYTSGVTTTTTDCYSMADVTGTIYIGGFVGRRYGGLIHRAYSTGFVTGDSNVGGFAGSGSNLTYSYWDTETSGQETSAGGTGVIGKTTEEMTYIFTIDTYETWDFIGEGVEEPDYFWGINPNENDAYPFLSWQPYVRITQPAVTTVEITDIVGTTALLHGEITQLGHANAVNHGFVWNTAGNPNINDDAKSELGVYTETGTFTYQISDLSGLTQYFVKAYVTVEDGIAYGEELSFTTGKKDVFISGSFVAENKPYDGNTSVTIASSDLSLTNLDAGFENVSLINVEYEFVTTQANQSVDVVIVSADITGEDVDRYNLLLTDSPSAIAEIFKKEITIIGSFTALDKVFDNNTDATIDENHLSLSGLIETDDVSLNAVAEFETADPGSEKLVILSGDSQLEGADVENYTLSLINAPTTTAKIYTEYNLTINVVGNGSVTVDGTVYTEVVTIVEGESVALVASPDTGWQFDAWSGDLASTDAAENIVMDANKTITATFTEIPEYTLTINIIGDGSVNVDGTAYTSAITVDEGTSFNLEAIADAGWQFEAWSGDLISTNASENVTMDDDKTIAATFIQIPEYTLTIAVVGNGSTTPAAGTHNYLEGSAVNLFATADAGWEFEKWVIGGDEFTTQSKEITITDDVTAIAYFVETTSTQYALTMAVVGQGTTIPPAGQHIYNENSIIDLEASPASGWEFEKWIIGTDEVTDTSTQITITEDITATAYFTEIPTPQHTLTINIIGDGSVNVDGTAYTSAITVDEGTIFNLEAIADAGWQFEAWSGDMDSEDALEVITMNENKNITATFSEIPPVYYTLTLVSNPAAGGIVSGGGEYEEDEVVAISTMANTDYIFENWTLDGNVISYSETFNYYMPAQDITLTANFIYDPAPDTYTLSVVAEPADWGTVTGSGEYLEGEQIPLTANANAGYEFAGWYIGETLLSENAEYTYTMPAENVTLKGVFQEEVSIVETDLFTINMYPNPAKDVVTISSDRIIKEIVISDIIGKIVYRETPEADHVELLLIGFEPGMYFINVYTNKEQTILKLQIAR